MKTHALVIDYKYCTGCHSCEVACRNEKDLSQDEWGIKVTEHGLAKIGGEWMWNYVPVPSSACDLCEERLEAGKRPSCVHHCLAQCMDVVLLKDLASVLAEKGDTVCVFVP